jgi:DsbC/DsbD-like thiol-disulfide interchange protein
MAETVRTMQTVIKSLLCTGQLVLIITSAQAQIHKPVKWHFSSIPISNKEFQLVFTANLEDGWHIYSQHVGERGPLPTTFTLEQNGNYELIKNVNEESTRIKSYDKTFLKNIVWFEKVAVFTQTVRLLAPATTIKGKVEFMACREELCLPPDDVAFSFEVRTPADQKKDKLDKAKF